ncbi:MAG: hypothetical protein R6X02_15880 [Enhygromyxa sp.]
MFRTRVRPNDGPRSKRVLAANLEGSLLDIIQDRIDLAPSLSLEFEHGTLEFGPENWNDFYHGGLWILLGLVDGREVPVPYRDRLPVLGPGERYFSLTFHEPGPNRLVVYLHVTPSGVRFYQQYGDPRETSGNVLSGPPLGTCSERELVRTIEAEISSYLDCLVACAPNIVEHDDYPWVRDLLARARAATSQGSR